MDLYDVAEGIVSLVPRPRPSVESASNIIMLLISLLQRFNLKMCISGRSSLNMLSQGGLHEVFKCESSQILNATRKPRQKTKLI